MRRSRMMTVLAIAAIAGLSSRARADFDLGTAGNFSVLGASTVTNTGPTVLDGGDLGVSPGTAITGFGPGTIVAPYTVHAGDAVAAQAHVDLLTAYNVAAGMAPTAVLTGIDLGGLTLQGGVYFFASSAQLTGTLTLDAGNDPNATFVFQVGSTLTTASASSVTVIHSVPGHTPAIIWQIGSSATLGTTTDFRGHILALASITMTTGAMIHDGSALALNAAVTLDSNIIVNSGLAAVPEPATMALALLGGALLGLPSIARTLRSRSPRSAPAPVDSGVV